jgi:hypothetical protein
MPLRQRETCYMTVSETVQLPNTKRTDTLTAAGLSAGRAPRIATAAAAAAGLDHRLLRCAKKVGGPVCQQQQ